MSEATKTLGDAAGDKAAETFEFAAVHPRVRYPSYVSFDAFLDVERLRSLDGYIRQRVRRHLAENEPRTFYTGPYRLDGAAPSRPGSRMIYLSCSELPDSYFDLDRTEVWKPGESANDFPLLMDFIATLPFEATGRMLIMYDDAAREVPAHRDHIETEVCHEFVWFRTNFHKQMYMLNHATGERQDVTSYSAWFDTVNQFHGCEAVDGLSFSIRVDGKFTEEFKAKIPRPAVNAASTPSYWASFKNELGEG
jgi:hypothetical protein